MIISVSSNRLLEGAGRDPGMRHRHRGQPLLTGVPELHELPITSALPNSQHAGHTSDRLTLRRGSRGREAAGSLLNALGPDPSVRS